MIAMMMLFITAGNLTTTNIGDWNILQQNKQYTKIKRLLMFDLFFKV